MSDPEAPVWRAWIGPAGSRGTARVDRRGITWDVARLIIFERLRGFLLDDTCDYCSVDAEELFYDVDDLEPGQRLDAVVHDTRYLIEAL